MVGHIVPRSTKRLINQLFATWANMATPVRGHIGPRRMVGIKYNSGAACVNSSMLLYFYVVYTPCCVRHLWYARLGVCVSYGVRQCASLYSKTVCVHWLGLLPAMRSWGPAVHRSYLQSSLMSVKVRSSCVIAFAYQRSLN